VVVVPKINALWRWGGQKENDVTRKKLALGCDKKLKKGNLHQGDITSRELKKRPSSQTGEKQNLGQKTRLGTVPTQPKKT